MSNKKIALWTAAIILALGFALIMYARFHGVPYLPGGVEVRP